ncbi:MAG: YfhO family protein, partial [Chloroflexi bacterium]|nr:YfhO family protein [Chloroflexota bacterium]
MSRRDLLIALAFLALAALFLAPVTFGGASLVPFDNLFRFPPWSTFASQFGVTTPHNELVSDLLLENYAWKKFIVDSLQAHEIPLWNPHLFAGVPFLAAGQNSALYPFSLLFYILPVDRAFGYFVALQLAIAALAMYALMRVHGLSRFAASLSGIVFAFSGFMIVSTAFPMILSAAAWLPAILACVELVVRARSDDRKVFFALVGAVLVGIQFLAGHIEISIYTLIVTAFYALWRVVAARRPPADRPAQELAAGADARNATDGSLRYRVRNLLLVGGMTVLGTALGAILLAPMFELVENNFRSGSVNFQDVLGWAYPPRQLVTFLIPDFFGNPTSHSYFDVFDLTNHRAPFGTIFWGVKNYVEAGAYVGILPLALALVACIAALRHYVSRRSGTPSARGVPSEQWPSLVALFAVLSVLSLFLIFPTGLYAVLFYLVPGFNQLHTPFRWVFPLTLSVAALAGIGVERLVPNDAGLADSGRLARLFRVVRNDAIGWLLVFLGSATLLGLAAT